MNFEFRLTGAGWADATVSHGGHSASLSASYLGDALGDLLNALLVILEGSAESRCTWWEEPGEYRWIFSRRGETIGVTILWFHGWDQPDDQGMPVFETEGSPDDVARPIVDEAARILAKWGEVGYLQQWLEAPFPTDKLDRLRTKLGA